MFITCDFNSQCPAVKISQNTAKMWRLWTCAECSVISISVANLVETRARCNRLDTIAIQEGVLCYQWASSWTYVRTLVMQSILTYYICLPLLWSSAVKTDCRQSFIPLSFAAALQCLSSSFHCITTAAETSQMQQCFIDKTTFFSNCTHLERNYSHNQNIGHKNRLCYNGVGHMQLGAVRLFINANIRRQNRCNL